MTDAILEHNVFYKYLQKHFQEELADWREPEWRVCIPTNDVVNEENLNRQFAESHALHQTEIPGQLISLGCGRSHVYHLEEDVLWCHHDLPPVALAVMHHCDSCSGGAGESCTGHKCHCDDRNAERLGVSKITVISEYLITVKSSVVHVLLVSAVLDPTPLQELALLPRLREMHLTTASQADEFLRLFSCHRPVLQRLWERLSTWQVQSGATLPLPQLQSHLHDLLLGTWDQLIPRHSVQWQTCTVFQDLLFNALDFIVVGRCHSVLWWRVRERCGPMDEFVTRRLTHLRAGACAPVPAACDLSYDSDAMADTDSNSPSCTAGTVVSTLPPTEGALSPHTGPVATPAAVVELAALGTVESALGRLHCVHDALHLLHAHAKQARAEVCAFTGTDCAPESVSEEELLGLLSMAIIEAQCQHLVSNLYYCSHYVFSLPDSHPLRTSLSLVRNALQRIMRLDPRQLPYLPSTPPLRREMSLHDLMKISSAVEQRFERRRVGGGSAHSSPAVSSLDLHYQQLTDRIQRSTMESATIDETPVAACFTPRCSSSPYSPYDPLTIFPQGPLMSPCSPNSSGFVNSFMEFISTLPSSIRASLRRKQTAQRRALDEGHEAEG